jgi:eukaryotic-like serine/threonine-protein kinase
VAILLRHVNERPAPPRSRNPQVTRELDSIVMRALEKEPAARFASAELFRASLEHAGAGYPDAGPRPTRASRRWS